MPQNALEFIPFTNSLKTLAPGRVDAQNSQWSSERHARYYAGSVNGFTGYAANQAGVTTSAGLATTYLGLCLSNPAASGRNLSILGVSASLIVAPAASTMINLITGFAAGGITVHTTPVQVQNGLVSGTATGVTGAGALVGLVDAACTLVGTPVWSMPISQNIVATNLEASEFLDLGGAITLPPGAYCAIGTNIAGPAAGFWGSILWEENPIATTAGLI